MTLLQLQLFGLSHQDVELEQNEEIAKNILQDLFSIFPFYQQYEKDPRFFSSLSLLSTLYSHIGNQNESFKILFDQILERYSCNPNAFILSYMKKILKTEKISKYTGIGVEEVQKTLIGYDFLTKEGRISVQKGSFVFPDSLVLKQNLKRECFQRSLEFLEENPSWNIVLSYLPNYFYKGYYHAYVTHENYLLDIARNAYFELESGTNLFHGKTLGQFSLEEIMEWISFLNRFIEGFSSSFIHPLAVLSWYLDYQDIFRKEGQHERKRNL